MKMASTISVGHRWFATGGSPNGSKTIVNVAAERGSIKQSVLLKAVESELDRLSNETGSSAPHQD